MTNQEAIEILKIERDHMVPTLLPERIEAMDMAISALQEQDVPDTNVGDMISRAEAIDAASRGCFELRGVFKNIKKEIEALPSAQPEIVRCNDCKHTDEDGVCQNSKGLAIQDDYSFCSWAERRTDD